MLYETALGEGNLVQAVISHIFLSLLCSQVLPCSCGRFEQWLALSRPSPGPGSFLGSGWGPRAPLQAPARHQDNFLRKSLSLHSDSFMPCGDIRHSPDSEVTALSPAMSVLSHIYWSLPRDNDVLRICMECASQYVVFHFISWFYHPFPITDQALGLRSTRENLTVFFPILDQISWTFALWLPLNNSV